MIPVDVIIVGQALEDFGLCANKTVEGLGLNTWGFIWPCDGIWGPASPSITTAWSSVLPGTVTVETCVD